ncbi:hypothetical protein BDW02DRAFT_512947, partial [Decorospora gaudefroyi]
EKRYLRDEFIVCDMILDEGLPKRIVEAVSLSRSPVDGIITYLDKYLTATAKAAEILGLGTKPSKSIQICTDKKQTREFVSSGMVSFAVSGLIDLKNCTEHWREILEYPLIVKPARGNLSEGVCSVENFTDLLAAVQRVEEHFLGRTILIEPYIAGPEVDANLVLLGGEILFCEINDDFPSAAEIPDRIRSISFAETSTIMPSALTTSELSMLRSTLAETLNRLNFRNGVFHIEARVQNSRMHYTTVRQGVELVRRDALHEDVAEPPSCFLIEINVRTPGHQETFAVEYTYGIDYYAMYTLLAITAPSRELPGHDLPFQYSELERLKAVSQPFLVEIHYPINIVFIAVVTG